MWIARSPADDSGTDGGLTAIRALLSGANVGLGFPGDLLNFNLT
ncbi:MAG TPA: hypothetical protein VEJ67_17145 [Candidatus Cybelea sp.]|nr:hypothetical protein [Candidatus Cybelea sp.]